MRPPRIAFVSSTKSSFIEIDRTFLADNYPLRSVLWRGKRSIPALISAIARCDVVFAWFALDHAYGACRVARTFGRKSVVVVGGVDAARRPDLGYGVYLQPRQAARSRYAVLHADRVLVVDDFLREELARNAGVRRREIVTVPTGFDVDRFTPDNGARTNVLTVGAVVDANVRRKGLETFVRTAAYHPDLPFVLVGGRPNEATVRLRRMATPNVRILPIVSEAELLEQYRRARVYVQASLYEGLPNALGEAMACGCIPVGTRVAGIPTLMGDAGYYVPEEDPAATADAIRQAFDRGNGEAARNRIVGGFTIQRRQAALRETIDRLAAGADPRPRTT
ncbi:MAG TPA: glycosyltransferase family 4 protein [Thermoplasmata archaeon]|nr:glycosyltransferase family 4 protein [Thermoplasmata archaeon]